LKTARLTFSLGLVVAVVCAWSLRQSASAASGEEGFGEPLRGLTPAERELFIAGLEEFQEEETAEDGLGPTFNRTGCAVCHLIPAIGGSSEIGETRGARDSGGVYHELLGGSLFQREGINERCRERFPETANIRATRQSVPLFGSGLIEAIPDGQLERYAALQRASHPEQAGRIHHVMDVGSRKSLVGRFGWKAQQAGLLAFSGDAYLNEMGITSRLFPEENAPNGDMNKLAACDTTPDPEDEDDAIDAFANFMRFLAPPPRRPESPQVERGHMMFAKIGCEVCHHEGFTAVSTVGAINGRRVDAFSDFLLHDIGTGDGIIQGEALGLELRTAPLWGVSQSAPYLHDGSAATLEGAIRRHGVQARPASEAFESLSESDQAALLAFLESI
jgi:CxxC motif-containing protein (DUF1111 family)